MEVMFLSSSNHSTSLSDSAIPPQFNPRWVRILDAILLILITMIGITGNTLVILSVCLSHKLRTRTNIFVVNLACADFFTCCTLPVVAWSLLAESEREMEAVDSPCAVVLVMTQTFIGCSILTLTFIALNRWMLISRRRELYDKFSKYRVIFSAQVISWTFPPVVTTLPILLGFGAIGYDKWSRNCALLPDNPYSYWYKVVMLASLMPAPMCIIIYCYWGIFQHVKSHNMKIQHSTTEGFSRTISDTMTGFRIQENGTTKKKHPNRTHQVQITKNLFYVVVTFLVCLTPYTIVEVFSSSAILVNHSKILVVLNSCLNPILYAVKHPHFRQVFKLIAHCKWKNIR